MQQQRNGHFYSVLTVIMAGMVGMMTWEIWANVFAPLAYGIMFDQMKITGTLLGLAKPSHMIFAHYGLGLLALPLAYGLIMKPLQKVGIFPMSWWALGVLYGFFLWAGTTIGSSVFAPQLIQQTALGSYPAGWLMGKLLVGVSISAIAELRRRGNQVIAL